MQLTDRIFKSFWLRSKQTLSDKTISLSIEGLREFQELPKSSCRLLMDMLEKLDSKYPRKSFDSVLLEYKYDDFGYKHRQNYHKDLKVLVKSGWLIGENGLYMVNPELIHYVGKQQYKWLLYQSGDPNRSRSFGVKDVYTDNSIKDSKPAVVS